MLVSGLDNQDSVGQFSSLSATGSLFSSLWPVAGLFADLLAVKIRAVSFIVGVY